MNSTNDENPVIPLDQLVFMTFSSISFLLYLLILVLLVLKNSKHELLRHAFYKMLLLQVSAFFKNINISVTGRDR